MKALAKLQLLSKAAGGGDSVCESLAGGTTSQPWDVHRALGRVKSVLLEVDLQQVYQDGKTRVKQQLLGSRAPAAWSPPEALLQPQQAEVPAPAVTQDQLDAMYGSNGWLRSTVLSVVGHASQAFMQQATRVHVSGAEHMRAALERPAGQALITVCNHVAALDDPLVVASLLPADLLDQPDRLRWTLCATDRCFRYKLLAPFFTAAKVLPVQRGAGLHQPGMVAAEKRLQQGDWVQVFPEGMRSRDPSKMGRVRPGVGRLVAAATWAPDGAPPVVLPFAHAGMDEVLPVGGTLPRLGKQVHVVVGEPVQVADLLQQARKEGWDQPRLYTAIAARVESSLQQLHAQAKSSLASATASPSQDVSVAAQMCTSAWGSNCPPTTAGSWQLRPGLAAAPSSPPSVSSAEQFATAGRPHTVSQQGSSCWWGPAQLRRWEHAAFSIWHHGWAERLCHRDAQAAAQVHPA